MPRPIARPVHLHWADDDDDDNNNARPCFGPVDLVLDLDKQSATPETLAALYGVLDPSVLTVWDANHAQVALDDNNHVWPLEADQHYHIQVPVVVDSYNDEKKATFLLPFAQIFAYLPGDTEEAKSDTLQSLSNTFYDKIWYDPTVPSDFSAKFVNSTSTARIQAFRQFDWLYEVFGGPAWAGEPPRETLLVPKVRAKHTSSRMTLEHSLTWLRLMDQTVQQVLADQPAIQQSMARYWLYFYAWYPYTEEERRTLRQAVISGEY